MRKFFLILVLMVPSFSFGCCGLQQQFSDEQWKKRQVKERIKYLNYVDFNKKLRLEAIKQTIDSNIDKNEMILNIRGGWNTPSQSYIFGSPLVASIEIGDPTLVGLVLDAKADPNIVSRGATPLIHLVCEDLDPNTSFHITNLLLGKKANVDTVCEGSRGQGGKTALSEAIRMKKPYLVRNLIRGAQLNTRTGPSHLTADLLAEKARDEIRKELQEALHRSPEAEIHAIVSQAWKDKNPEEAKHQEEDGGVL